MLKSPIKVKLQRRHAVKETTGEPYSFYLVTQISGAITIGGYNGQIIRAGDSVEEKTAENLLKSYIVTVIK